MSSAVYLDHAATTPVDAQVVAAMLECLGADGDFGNPASTTHAHGRRAAARVGQARAELAALLGCDPAELVWTSGATEASNLALKGALQASRRGRHLITCSTEHKSVLDVCAQLRRAGAGLTVLDPGADGLLDPARLAAALRPDTALVSVMAVNNETGVVQDIAALGRLVRAHGALFHVDAAQAAGRIDLTAWLPELDLMSLSAHKLYGPKGIGALYVRRLPRVRLDAQMHGGGQERGLRAGTLAVHQIVGFGTACRLLRERREADARHLAALDERLRAGLCHLPGTHLHGHPQQRVAGILNLGFEGIGSESLFAALPGLALSGGSACSSAEAQPSHVLRALGVPDAPARCSLRLSPGRSTSLADIDLAIARITRAVGWLRGLSPLCPDAPLAEAAGTDPEALAALNYGPAAQIHFRDPQHAGTFACGTPGVSRATAGPSADGDLIRLELRFGRDGRIAEVRQSACGTVAAIAAASWLATQLPGLDAGTARALHHADLAAALGLPAQRLPASVLALRALAAALDAAAGRLPETGFDLRSIA